MRFGEEPAGQLFLDFSSDSQFSEAEHGSYIELYLDATKSDLPKRYFVGTTDRVGVIYDFIARWASSTHLDLEVDESIRKLISTLDSERDQVLSVKNNAVEKEPLSSLVGVLPARELLGHQKSAVQTALAIGNYADFSVPGSGKTTVALAVYALLKKGNIVDKLMVIGPASSFDPWEEELKAAFGTPPYLHRLTGTPRARENIFAYMTLSEVLLSTYQMASREEEALRGLLSRGRYLLVLDEAHNIKRYSEGKWSETMLRLAPFAARRMILTGTPAPRDVFDLWTQFTFLWPSGSAVGSRTDFQREFQDGGSQAVADIVKPFFHRTKKSDLGLPPPHYEITTLEPDSWPPVQRRVVRLLEVRTLRDLQTLELRAEDIVTLRNWRRSRITRLLMAASNPGLLNIPDSDLVDSSVGGNDHYPSLDDMVGNYDSVETSAKIRWVIDKTRALVQDGKKVVIWTWFVGNIKLLQDRLSDLNALVAYGGLKPFEDEEDSIEELSREKNIRMFKEEQKNWVLVANPAACAESISLHKACHDAIYVDRTFNCGQFMQSLDRIHRVGSDAPVTYHIPVMNCAIDRLVDRKLTQRQRILYKLLLDDALPVGGWSEDLLVDEEEELVRILEELRQMLEQEASEASNAQ